MGISVLSHDIIKQAIIRQIKIGNCLVFCILQIVLASASTRLGGSGGPVPVNKNSIVPVQRRLLGFSPHSGNKRGGHLIADQIRKLCRGEA